MKAKFNLRYEVKNPKTSCPIFITIGVVYVLIELIILLLNLYIFLIIHFKKNHAP